MDIGNGTKLYSRRCFFWLGVLAGFAVGVCSLLVVSFARNHMEQNRRYEACLYHDFSHVDLTAVSEVWKDDNGYTWYQFAGLKNVQMAVKEEFTIFYEQNNGCVYSYRDDVLDTVLIGQYNTHGIDYQYCTVRTPEEAKEIALLLQQGDEAEIKKQGGRTWMTADGKTFVN